MPDSRPTPRLPSAYRLVAALVRPFMRTFTRRDWRGAENLPRTGGFVVVSNHLSYFDPFSVAHYLYDHGHPPYFLGKEEVFRIPVAGRILLGAGQIPVFRKTGRAVDAYRAAVAGVQLGKCVVIYPEGTITRDPDLWPMVGKTGAARVALQTRCPLIPVAQWGSHEVLPPYSRRLRLLPRRTMHIVAGPAVALSDLYGRALDEPTLRLATDRLLAALTALLEDLRGETAPAERFDPRQHGLPDIGYFRREQP